MQIREFLPTDIQAVKNFADRVVGAGYYSLNELAEIQKKSIAATGEICSFLLVSDDNEVHGLRLAFPPGNWEHGKGAKIRADLWPTKLSETAYFQSLFVAGSLQGQGWGPKLSEKPFRSLRNLVRAESLRTAGKNPPNNSSMRYLQNMGFRDIIEHPDYWVDVNYVCTRDGNPCHCTAIEMHLLL